MRNLNHPDYILAGTSLLLVLLGFLILTSASAVISQKEFGNSTHFLFHQIMVGLIPGAILGYIAFKIPLRLLKKWSLWLLIINSIAMLLVFFPKIGVSSGGAHRWINLGFVRFQPSEFLKISFLLYISAWIDKRTKIKNRHILKDNINNRQILFQFLIILGFISLLLILQPDISTLGIIAIMAVLAYFLSDTPIYHTILIILTGIAGLFILIKIAPYRLNRFFVFLKPDIDPMGIGYQVKQALIAIGSGGILGQGFGESLEKLRFLPHPSSDSIFAVFSQETGFIGSLFLIFLFLIFVWRGFKIAKSHKDKFSQLVAIGISFWIIAQAFINIGSMIRILPLTGIPLPFISYGGSSFIAELIAVGILLNISKSTT